MQLACAALPGQDKGAKHVCDTEELFTSWEADKRRVKYRQYYLSLSQAGCRQWQADFKSTEETAFETTLETQIFQFITRIMLNLVGYFATLKTSFRGTLSTDLFIQKQNGSTFFETNKKSQAAHKQSLYPTHLESTACLTRQFLE